MPIPFDKVKPLEKGIFTPLYLAAFIQYLADEEVGKVFGVEDPEKKPLVWVHIADEMLTQPMFTGVEGFAGATDKARDHLKIFIPRLEEFLIAPHIFDNLYPHDPVRRMWAMKNIKENDKIVDKKLKDKAFAYFKKNRFSMNGFISIEAGFKNLARYLREAGSDSEEAKYVLQVVENQGKPGGLPDLTQYSGHENYKKYDRMEPARKWMLSHQYELIGLRLIEIIAKSAGIPRERVPRKMPPFKEIAGKIGVPNLEDYKAPLEAANDPASQRMQDLLKQLEEKMKKTGGGEEDKT